MNVYTDASFSPEGEESHGCVVVMMKEEFEADGDFA